MYDNSTEYIFSHWLIFGAISSPLTILGLIGNSLTLHTLYQTEISSMTSTIFLKFLTAADGSILFFYFISFCLPMLVSHNVSLWMDDSGIYKIIYPMALTSQTIAVYTVVVFSIVRYITICQPLRCQRYRKRRHMRLLVGSIFTYSVIFNIPRMLEHLPIVLNTVNCTVDTDDNNNTVNCTRVWSSLGENDLYKSVYQSYGYTFGIFVIPVVIVCVLNARLAILLHRSRFAFNEEKKTNLVALAIIIPSNNPKECEQNEGSSLASDDNERTHSLIHRVRTKNPYLRSQMSLGNSRYSRRTARVTGRLLCLVSVFIVFQSFPMVDNLLITFLHDGWKATMSDYNVFYAMCQFSVMLNSSLNTVLYCFLGQRFRRTFLNLLQRRRNRICSFLRHCKCNRITSLFHKN